MRVSPAAQATCWERRARWRLLPPSWRCRRAWCVCAAALCLCVQAARGHPACRAGVLTRPIAAAAPEPEPEEPGPGGGPQNRCWRLRAEARGALPRRDTSGLRVLRPRSSWSRRVEQCSAPLTRCWLTPLRARSRRWTLRCPTPSGSAATTRASCSRGSSRERARRFLIAPVSATCNVSFCVCNACRALFSVACSSAKRARRGGTSVRQPAATYASSRRGAVWTETVSLYQKVNSPRGVAVLSRGQAGAGVAPL